MQSLTPQPECPSTVGTPRGRWTRRLLVAIGIYSALLVLWLNVVIFLGENPVHRAIFLMADGLVLFWVILGGLLTPWLRRRLTPRLRRIPIPWPVRFVLLCTAMALIEEAITTSMTNLAPWLGVTPEQAHITASTNYLYVVLFHSVVVFVPMFGVWAWMLSRWDFAPLDVLLLFGLTGSLAEATIHYYSLFGGFWVFVYGLMVYLPATTVPPDRPVRPVKFRHRVMAVFLPPLSVVVVAPIILLREWLQIPLFPGS